MAWCSLSTQREASVEQRGAAPCPKVDLDSKLSFYSVYPKQHIPYSDGWHPVCGNKPMFPTVKGGNGATRHFSSIGAFTGMALSYEECYHCLVLFSPLDIELRKKSSRRDS